MDRTEQVARAICGARCLNAEVLGRPCIAPDHRNGPCDATQDQLVLSWIWLAAQGAVAVTDTTPAQINRVAEGGA